MRASCSPLAKLAEQNRRYIIKYYEGGVLRPVTASLVDQQAALIGRRSTMDQGNFFN